MFVLVVPEEDIAIVLRGDLNMSEDDLISSGTLCAKGVLKENDLPSMHLQQWARRSTRQGVDKVVAGRFVGGSGYCDP